jgi:hypothetical protein
LFGSNTALAEMAAFSAIACAVLAIVVHRLVSNRHVLGLDGPAGSPVLGSELP